MKINENQHINPTMSRAADLQLCNDHQPARDEWYDLGCRAPAPQSLNSLRCKVGGKADFLLGDQGRIDPE